jgi:hypothetical protein
VGEQLSQSAIGEAVAGQPGWPERAPEQEQVDDLQNKLATVICNAEIALEMVEGPARERLEAALRAAWTASRLIASAPLGAGLAA